jgi:hypothetical protein
VPQADPPRLRHARETKGRDVVPPHDQSSSSHTIEVSEALKPRRIEIVSSGGPKPVGQENVHQIDQAEAA